MEQADASGRLRRDKIIASRANANAAAEKMQPSVERTLLLKMADLLAGIDLDHFADEVLRGGDAEGKEHLHQEKSLQFVGRVQIAAGRVRQLKLDACSPSAILDIGAGPGFFCWAAQQLGHNVVAIQPNVGDRGIDFSAFMRMFGVPQSGQFIKPQTSIVRDQALPESARFDLVTAFAITFNRSGRQWWSTKDYLFFLNDIRSNFLKPGGRVVLKFNNTEPSLTPQSIITYYEEVGRMLAPFIVDQGADTGFTLDLSKDGWSAASEVVLTQPLQRKMKQTLQRKTKQSVAPSGGSGEQLRLQKKIARLKRRNASKIA